MFTALLIVGVVWIRKFEGVNYRLIPHWKDPAVALGSLLVLGIIIIPLGLLTGFLKWPGDKPASFVNISSTFLELFFTVAVTEEIFFRQFFSVSSFYSDYNVINCFFKGP